MVWDLGFILLTNNLRMGKERSEIVLDSPLNSEVSFSHNIHLTQPLLKYVQMAFSLNFSYCGASSLGEDNTCVQDVMYFHKIFAGIYEIAAYHCIIIRNRIINFKL